MTVLTPGIGQGLLFTQGGAGASPGYSALDDRRAANGALQEGVLNASDFMVVQRAAGANMSVDIGMPAGGFAYVQGDAVSGQGLYTVPVHSATDNLAITAANPTNPRVDQVILEVFDNVHDVSGNNLAQTRVVAGTATAGATLTNRTGAAALPSSALLLADVLVGQAATTIPNTKIRDRRKWARGAFIRVVRTAADYNTTATVQTLVDSVNLQPRVECSGVPLRVTLSTTAYNATAATTVAFDFAIDNTQQILTKQFGGVGYPANMNQLATLLWEQTPVTAGSHLIGPMWAVSAGTGTLLANGTFPLEFTVEEIVRPNTANNTTTTG